ncbi:hypothetical protein B0H14DRAFT_3660995 [Mycena olivaceomarginata]|nr:hypothetical protein B0H14DRAFT_3660995 [Mycena olivaceomarginata]
MVFPALVCPTFARVGRGVVTVVVGSPPPVGSAVSSIRLTAGVGLPASTPGILLAERYWTKIVKSPRSSTKNIAGLLFGAEGRSIRLGDCMRAGIHAELAAKVGLGTAPGMIMLGRTLHRFRHGEHKETFSKWTHFWAAVDARAAEVQAELDKEDAKRFVRPSRYKCAAPGYPVEASEGSMLRASGCAGKCEDAYKPRYCTKECQVADWKTHKRMCKSGLEALQSEAPPPSRSPMDPSFTGGHSEISPDWSLPTQSKNPTFKTARNGEYSVEIGGINVHTSPSQLSAQGVKELAQKVKVLSADK